MIAAARFDPAVLSPANKLLWLAEIRLCAKAFKLQEYAFCMPDTVLGLGVLDDILHV